jgi:hypothetical protein
MVVIPCRLRRSRSIVFIVVEKESGVAVVVVSLFGYVDGVERTVGDPGVGSALALAAPRSRFGGLT